VHTVAVKLKGWAQLEVAIAAQFLPRNPDTLDWGREYPGTLGKRRGLVRSIRNMGIASALLDRRRLVASIWAPHQKTFAVQRSTANR